MHSGIKLNKNLLKVTEEILVQQLKDLKDKKLK